MDEVNEAAGFLLANPIFLIPVLLLAAVLVYAILKKLIKMALIVGIAGAMYVALMEYFGSGF
jgi:nitrate/nitrite transporter NarK